MTSSANGNNGNKLEPKLHQQQAEEEKKSEKNETKLGFQESWIDQQERELADLLSLGQCNNTLKIICDDDDEPRLPPLNDWSAMCRGISIERDFDSLMRPNCRNRYLLPDYTYCSGLGNQMYRFASLYGIGRASCRRPIFKKGDQECVNGERQKELWRHHDRETPDEIEQLFPLYNSQLKYINFSEISASDIRYVDGFATKCCTYDDPARLQLHAMKEKFVQFKKTDFLQHYKFFDARRKDMRQIFQFAPKICKSVLASKCKLFGTDRTSYKLCVHNRLSDFVQSGWQSDLHFAVNATKYIVNELKPKFGNISVVLLGSERDFLDKIEQKLDKNVSFK
uniref:Uncharacterized protein n=1 Tax=Globodera pallida TaxID=36090 RepID=A0A183BZ83_GLOPA